MFCAIISYINDKEGKGKLSLAKISFDIYAYLISIYCDNGIHQFC